VEHSATVDLDGAIERLRSCPLCLGKQWNTLPTPGQWIGMQEFGQLEGQLGLVACRGCGLVFVNPRPSQDRLSCFYSGDTYSCHQPTGSASAGAKAEYILRLIGEHLPAAAPRKLLDYGAGSGAFLSHAQRHGWEAFGFEPGRRGLESCRQAGLQATDDIDELPHGQFGLVTLHHVFEHLSDPIETLDRISKLLAPDGRIYIEVPNARSLRARLALPVLSRHFNIDQRHRAYPIHLMYYSADTLCKMIGKAGWGIAGTFTLGMGIDEFFVRSVNPSKQAPYPSNQQAKDIHPKRRLRHILRDSFLTLGLGENLAVIAHAPNK
jgi:SAM-dependent methyltransferase